MPPAAGRRNRRGWNALLLPLALVVVVLEDVLWAAARAVLRLFSGIALLQRLQSELRRLPGWAALPLFLVPEALGKLGELWSLAIMARGHVTHGVLVYGAVRVVATLIVVFIFHACEPALMRVAWFAYGIGLLRRARDWAMQQVQPMRDRIHRSVRGRRAGVGKRFAAARLWLRRRRAPR